MKLQGKIAVVTGATKGIGRGFAEALAAEGANIVVASRTQADCEATARALAERHGVQTLARPTDVTDLAAITALMEAAKARFGGLDILVNNAGSALTKRAEEVTEADWDRVLDLDLKGVFFCAQAAGRIMMEQKSGKIINVASIMGLVGDRQILPYCVAKGGVVQMTKALALEWARHNIQVNTICPGYVVTEMNRADLETEKVAGHILKKIAMRRYGQVEDMAAACVYLACRDSDYMTGAAMVIDGGWTCE